MFKKISLFIALISIVTVVVYQSIFTIPVQPELVTGSPSVQQKQFTCFDNPQPKPLNTVNGLSVLTWNIYKQNKTTWSAELTELSDETQLVLLQEASMTDELKKWISSNGWGSNQVNAFEAFNTSAGVLSLARELPVQACGFTYTEPWLQLPKSALWTLYDLDNGQQLAVVNIHAVNFTFGTEDYQQQLLVLTQKLAQHHGPMIFAGDFNSWSEARMNTLKVELQKVGLSEVMFMPDNRTQFISGLVLDHVFYRGLKLEEAEAPVTDASDHNPMKVRFSVLDTSQKH
ncbi:endonuclease/exonuclease/phosphatase family protein [Vibrio makurazakiensis]|uniref:endonuclease/exonuclease/phosphatase family protein n=1 Tax=Vibrio makurazakiensis TaxID=2910250 RepID=UPI003D1417BE